MTPSITTEANRPDVSRPYVSRLEIQMSASTPTPNAASALEINTLGFRYPSGFELSLPSLILARGEELLLVGRSGCGKSTLLQLIAGLLDPTTGSIRVGGMDIHALRGAQRDRFRGRSIGMVFQTFNLLHGFTARENVLIALLMSDLPKADAATRAETLLRSLGLDRLDALAEELSVGQQQRVAIARALACRPTLVLADEPTASLDPENALNAVRVLRDACRDEGAALLVVSHDPALESHFARRERLEQMRETGTSHVAGGVR
jgi:putative ABC transport system ATP-binding protein